MLNSWIRILALVYALICIFESLFLPAHINIQIDLLFFPFALVQLLFFIKKMPEARWLMFGFLVFFLWTGIVTLLNFKVESLVDPVFPLVFLKWSAVIAGLASVEVKSWKLEKSVDMVFLMLVGINAWILINPMGTGESLQSWFAQKGYTTFVYFNDWNAFRLSGTFMSPNDNALVFALFSIYYGLFRRKREWGFLILALAMLSLTQSRTVFLATMLVFVCYSAKIYFEKLTWKKVLYASTILAAILLVLASISGNLRSILTGEAFVSHSFVSRLENVFRISEADTFHQWIGSGKMTQPMAFFGFYLDSEYYGWLYQFGWVGLTLFLGFLVLQLYRVPLLHHKYSWQLSIAFLGMVSLTNFTFQNLQTGGFIAGFLGLLVLNDKMKRNESPMSNPTHAPINSVR